MHKKRDGLMQMEMVLTVMASDRPGIVETLADVVAACDGNWVDSAMSRLGGQFAGILRLTIEKDKVAGMEKALQALKQDGFVISVCKDTGKDTGKGSAQAPLAVSRRETRRSFTLLVRIPKDVSRKARRRQGGAPAGNRTSSPWDRDRPGPWPHAAW